jgi:hypothetical protein
MGLVTFPCTDPKLPRDVELELGAVKELTFDDKKSEIWVTYKRSAPSRMPWPTNKGAAEYVLEAFKQHQDEVREFGSRSMALVERFARAAHDAHRKQLSPKQKEASWKEIKGTPFGELYRDMVKAIVASSLREYDGLNCFKEFGNEVRAGLEDLCAAIARNNPQ